MVDLILIQSSDIVDNEIKQHNGRQRFHGTKITTDVFDVQVMLYRNRMRQTLN